MSITVEFDSELEQQLQQEAAASGMNPEAFVVDVVTTRLNRFHVRPASASPLSVDESRWLQEINRGPDEATWQRYRQLVQQRQDETISEGDLSELIRLSDVIEVDHVRRLEAVSELAKLRGTTLDALMKELGLWRSNGV